MIANDSATLGIPAHARGEFGGYARAGTQAAAGNVRKFLPSGERLALTIAGRVNTPPTNPARLAVC